MTAKSFVDAYFAEPVFGAQLPERKFRTHSPDKCVGEYCCIHNPSDHPLRDADLNFRFDRGLTERICPEHGASHPDPDSLAFLKRVMGPEEYKNRAFEIHGCCGCC